MKVLHLSTSDSGGAGRAAYRIHQALNTIGIHSQMLVGSKISDDYSVLCPQTKLQKASSLLKLSYYLDGLPLIFYPNHPIGAFSPQWLPSSVLATISQINPDIINLNWVGHGFLSIEALARLKKPLVWTLADMWPFTGGCYYTQDCDRYQSSCGACPQLNSDKDNDLSRWIWQRKKQVWDKLNLTIVTPSHWLAQCARASSLFKDLPIEIIPYALNTSVYKPLDREVARQALNLPQDKHLILFGALRATSDQRKGFHLLRAALKRLSETGWKNYAEIIVFGASKPSEPVDLGFKTHYLGHLNDDLSLAVVYSAASVMIVPSVQEAFGQTASESISCATPVVAFDQTGVTEIVDHQRNGYLAKPFEVEDLARGIAWILENDERYVKLSQEARYKAEQEFTFTRQAERYLSLFTRILKEQNSFTDHPVAIAQNSKL